MEITEYIESRAVDPGLRQMLEAFEGDDATLVSLLIRELRPSANSLRGLLSLATEVAKRDSRSLRDVFSHSDVQEVFEEENLNRKKTATTSSFS